MRYLENIIGVQFLSIYYFVAHIFRFIKLILQAWTNGRVRATNHRVMMSGDETRYSVALFAVPKPGYIIKAPEKMVDEDHPLLFRPFEIHQFLDFCYADPGRISSATALNDYCGV